MKKIAALLLVLALCLGCAAAQEAGKYDHLLPSMQKIDTCAVISASPGMNVREGAVNLFDGSMETKWCAEMEGELYVVFETASPIRLEKYTIATANDNAEYKGRNPTDWELYGAVANSTEWEPILAVYGDTTLQDENYATYRFTLEAPSAEYNYFLLVISANGGDRCMQISEFILNDLWTCDTAQPAQQEQDFSATADPDCKTCGGDGYVSRSCGSCFGNGKTDCMACGGDGKDMCLACDGRGYMRSDHSDCFSCSGGYKRCSSCSGSGKRSCSSCSGRGKVQSACSDCNR